jgi:hypothetical protein
MGRVGLRWIDDRTAVISTITALDLATMKAHLVLRKLYTDGSSGRLIRLAEISAGRDSGCRRWLRTVQFFVGMDG